jgi:hypothetical protein
LQQCKIISFPHPDVLSDVNKFASEARFSVFPRSVRPGPQEAHTQRAKSSAARPDKLVRAERPLARAISIQICSGSAAKTATTCAAAAKLEALQRRASCLFFSLSLSLCSCSCAFVRRHRLEADEFRLMARQVEQEVSVSPGVVFDCTPLTEREISSGALIRCLLTPLVLFNSVLCRTPISGKQKSCSPFFCTISFQALLVRRLARILFRGCNHNHNLLTLAQHCLYIYSSMWRQPFGF